MPDEVETIQPLIDELRECQKHFEAMLKNLEGPALSVTWDAEIEKFKSALDVNAAIIERLDMPHLRKMPF